MTRHARTVQVSKCPRQQEEMDELLPLHEKEKKERRRGEDGNRQKRTGIIRQGRKYELAVIPFDIWRGINGTVMMMMIPHHFHAKC